MSNEIFNLSNEEVINKLSLKNEKYAELINRKLKTKDDVWTFYDIIEDLIKFFDFGLDTSIYASGGSITFYPTGVTIWLDYPEGNHIPVKDVIISVYNQMKEKIKIEILDFLKYIKDKNYDFVTARTGAENDYSIELHYNGILKDTIRMHICSNINIDKIQELKNVMDNIAQKGYSYLISSWYEKEWILDTHKFCYNRTNLYSLSLGPNSYYLFDTYNTRHVNSNHRFIIIGHTYGTEEYEKVIYNLKLLNELLELIRKIN